MPPIQVSHMPPFVIGGVGCAKVNGDRCKERVQCSAEAKRYKMDAVGRTQYNFLRCISGMGALHFDEEEYCCGQRACHTKWYHCKRPGCPFPKDPYSSASLPRTSSPTSSSRAETPATSGASTTSRPIELRTTST